MPKKYTEEEFVCRAIAKHGLRYDYSMARYQDSCSKICVICQHHGPFYQRAANHLIGHGCPACKAQGITERQTGTANEFIDKARSIHGEKYDYSLVDYKKSSNKVVVICRTHGEFLVTPNSHLSRKTGCPKCAGKNKSTTDFVSESISMHGDKYGYQKTQYSHIKNKVTITCKTHGDFEQSAEAHLLGHGCKKCWNESQTSSGEEEVADFVSSLGLNAIRNDRVTIGQEIDILINDVNIGIEFNGCYWHSHKVMHHRQHEYKYIAAKRAGIRIITVWDFDWAHKQEIMRKLIKNATRKNDSEIIGARKCSISVIDGSLASDFYDKNHIQGRCYGSILDIGLIYSGDIVASMSFTLGGARRGKTGYGEFELARFATSCRVPGAASRLFSYFIKARAPLAVWSFSDNQHFSGDIYRTLGFKEDGAIPADYKVVNGYSLKTWHKSLWQRKLIQNRLTELRIPDEFKHETDPRTEFEMHDAARVLRVYDSGKTRWVWTP